jgi:hypothetical protein
VRVEIHSLIIYLICGLFWKNRIAVHPKGIGYASGGEDGFVRVHHFDDSYYKAKPYGDTEIID